MHNVKSQQGVDQMINCVFCRLKDFQVKDSLSQMPKSTLKLKKYQLDQRAI